MSTTRSRGNTKGTFLGVVITSALIAGGFLFAIGSSGWLSEDKRPEKAVTLSVVWGDGTQVAGGAVVTWHTTSGGQHSVTVRGRVQPKRGQDTGTEHFVEVILVRVGDRVTLAGNADNPHVPVGTTITIDNVPHGGGYEISVVVS
jgi:multidrug efflux pump subunit AcrA (membrane-fusion protein)